ncbi:MAG TPA: Uma2 family endonuclease [Longimicrobiales bacterium]
MATPAHRLTAEEAIRRYGDPDAHGYEFVNGRLVPVSPASPVHGRVIGEVARVLGNFVHEHGGGRVYVDPGCVLGLPGDPERMRGPDVAFIADETIAAAGGESYDHFLRAVPELAVEIFSITNEKEPAQFQERVRDLLDAGVRILWVIYPRGRYAVVHHPDGWARMLREHESLDGEDVLPGLSIRVGELLDG